MINAVKGSKHPVGANVYGSLAGDAWYRAQLMLQDQKIGHYMHVAPKAVFFSQLFGSFIGIPLNYAVTQWVINTKGDFLIGAAKDPTAEWTGQELASSLTTSVQYVLLVSANIYSIPSLTLNLFQGPKRLFELPQFRIIPYGFLVGAIAPVILFALHRSFPRAKFHLWNTTIFFSQMSSFYGNISSGPLSAIIGGFIVMYWCFRYALAIFSCTFDCSGTNMPSGRDTTSFSQQLSTLVSTSTCCLSFCSLELLKLSLCQIGGEIMQRIRRDALH
jgi:OPT oligopeptide transporter protein